MVIRYEPMSLARLGQHLMVTADVAVRWKLVWEFLEEYRWEPAETHLRHESARRTYP